MEINEKLYVDADEFFNKMAESIAYDISESTGKKVRTKQITKGYSYTKKLKNKMGRKGEVKVTITDFESPRIYAAKFDSINGINYLSYEIEKFDDAIGVTYREDFEGASISKKLNYKIMTFFYNRGSKKKARRLLRAMEQYIIQSRETSEEETAIEERTEEQASSV